MAVRPIHHRGDGEAAGECDGLTSHFRIWIREAQASEFIRIGGSLTRCDSFGRFEAATPRRD